MYSSALSSGVNIVNSGSPSRIRMVRRISLGITTRPRSSMRLTIPVAFIPSNLSSSGLAGYSSAGIIYAPYKVILENHGNRPRLSAAQKKKGRNIPPLPKIGPYHTENIQPSSRGYWEIVFTIEPIPFSAKRIKGSTASLQPAIKLNLLPQNCWVP